MKTKHGREQTEELPLGVLAGPWRLEISTPHGVEALHLEAGEERVLGSGPDADIQLSDSAVSARHARLRGGEEGISVEDLSSTNGVWVGAARVTRAQLKGSGASFLLGRSTVVLQGSSLQVDDVDVEPIPGLVGRSLPMRRLARDVRRYAPLRAPVLIRGESGTGKDVVARSLHQLSNRRGAYVPLNVGAISESLADAELFGHRRGAFTGALANRPGAFEQAHHGTLFLDEIAELSASLQVKLLRVVEDGSVRPLGATQALPVDARIVSATWAPLEERAGQGAFRADLLHRISTVVLRVPPLRERKGDLLPLSQALLQRVEDELGPRRLSPAALGQLSGYEWPGNVRELYGTLYRAAVQATSEEIGPAELGRALPALTPSRCALQPAEARRLLEQHGGNVSAAARAARVPRSTFRTWLKRR